MRTLFRTFTVQGWLSKSFKSSLLTCLTWVQRKPHRRLGNPVTNLLTFFLCVNSARMTIPQSNTRYLPNSVLDIAGKFVPIVDLTHDDGDRYSLTSDIPYPMPSQTGLNPWQSQYPRTYHQGSPAVLGHQETVQLVTQRAREAWNVLLETTRRALLQQQREILAATQQFAPRHAVPLARNGEVHNNSVQMQVRQLEGHHNANRFFAEKLIREFHSETMQFRTSAVQPDPTQENASQRGND